MNRGQRLLWEYSVPKSISETMSIFCQEMVIDHLVAKYGSVSASRLIFNRADNIVKHLLVIPLHAHREKAIFAAHTNFLPTTAET